MKIIDGKKIRDEILEQIKKEVTSLPFQPVFCDVLVGEDKSSVQYVQMKKKYAEAVGIRFQAANFPSSIKTETLVSEIEKLNKMENMCGIIVQLPLPDDIDREAVLNSIDPSLDVDCLGKVTSDNFYSGKIDFGFPAATACIKLLDSIEVSLKDKKVVVLGQGELVGKPVSMILKQKGLSPVSINTKTENKEELIKQADVIISGIGQGKFIKGEMIKKGVILIDAGTSESGNSIVGDIDKDSVEGVAEFLSPVPGGVGPVTIAMLLKNVLNVAKHRYE